MCTINAESAARFVVSVIIQTDTPRHPHPHADTTIETTTPPLNPHHAIYAAAMNATIEVLIPMHEMMGGKMSIADKAIGISTQNIVSHITGRTTPS